MLFGSFRGFSPHCAPPQGLVTLCEWGAHSFLPYPQVQSVHFQKRKFLKSTWLSKSTAWKSRAHHPRMGKFCFFFSVSLQEQPVVRFPRGWFPHSQSWPICVSGLLLWEKAVKLFFQGVLALLHFTKHTINPLLLPPFSLSYPTGCREPLPHIRFISTLSCSGLFVTSFQGPPFWRNDTDL